MKVILFSGKATEGKDASANILKDLLERDGKKVLLTHYGDLLKYICKTYFGWNGEKDEVGRLILQKTGTDVIRHKMPNFWVRFVADILLMFPDEWDYCLIPDCRFPNEVEVMNGLFDTLIVRVNRLNYESPLTEEQQNHISETALDNYQFDYYLDSESGLDNLRVEVEKMYEYIKAKDMPNG
jgi:hypothetical protein